MTRNKTAAIVAASVALAAILLLGYQRWQGSGLGGREELLAKLPADATAVLYVDLDALRQSPFLAELYKWVPQGEADADYAEFRKSTGFNYETDLHRAAIAILKRGQDTTLYVVAEGSLDRKKIAAYASQSGTREARNGTEIFSVPINGTERRISFTFLRDDRIVLTNDTNLLMPTSQPVSDLDAQAWRERFRRLAGSPILAVVRQDAAAGEALSARAPGGLQSPQLSALIDQLQWITVAGKPEADHLRIVLEGEGTADGLTRQISELLAGLLSLAEAGLNDPKVRQQLQPQLREAYLELLKSADVSQIDRGDTKSVRLIFDVTPALLEAARSKSLGTPAGPQEKALPGKKATIRN